MRVEMDYEKLKAEVQQIAEIAAGVPEPFQQRCFEVLLNALLTEEPTVPPKRTEVREEEQTQKQDPPAAKRNDRVQLNATVRAWMKRTGVTEDELNGVLFVEDGQVHFIMEPKPPTNSDAQIQWALLLALGNALLTTNLAIDAETVRSMVQEKGFYDRNNFAAIFRRSASLFRAAPEPQGDAQPLSTEGQEELATLVKRLAEAKK